MIRTLIRYLATLSSLGLIVVLLGAFTETGEAGGILTERGGRQSGASVAEARLFVPPTTLAPPVSAASVAADPGPGAASVAPIELRPRR